MNYGTVYKPVRWRLFLEGIKALNRYRDGWDVLTGPSIGIGSADPFAIAFEKGKIYLGMSAGTE
ncbi:MAG: hypothetical protein ACFCUL_04815 [Flavobacteriaceae bacterium]